MGSLLVTVWQEYSALKDHQQIDLVPLGNVRIDL